MNAASNARAASSLNYCPFHFSPSRTSIKFRLLLSHTGSTSISQYLPFSQVMTAVSNSYLPYIRYLGPVGGPGPGGPGVLEVLEVLEVHSATSTPEVHH